MFLSKSIIFISIYMNMSTAVNYPGYNVDPRVRKVINRCVAIGMTDFRKPYSNKRELFKFTTLERDLCIPIKLPMTEAEKRKRLIKSKDTGKMVLQTKVPIKIKIKPRKNDSK
jgi:hypothetical protein